MNTQTNIPTTRRALITSFLFNFFDIASNIVVAAVSGSTTMLAGAMEGLADLCAVGLLLIGHKRAQKKADRLYQFGYGKELYFWALLAGVVILLITATLSFYMGLQKVLQPQPIALPWLTYIVLGLGVVTNGYALSVSARALLAGKPFYALPRIFTESSLLAPKTTVVLDLMGMTAAMFGLINLVIYGLTGDARFDGIGAMVIGVTLAFFAVVLLSGIRGLITGRSVPKPLAQDIRAAALKVPGVKGVLDLRTMILGSSSTLVNLEVHLQDGLTTDEIEAIIDKVKHAVGQAVPGYTHVQVEPETPARRRTHIRKY